MDNESEYESDSEDFSDEDDQVLKPVFVSKQNRVTIKEREEKQLKEESLNQKLRQENEIKKNETRVLVAESIRKIEESKELNLSDADSEAGIPDDTDNLEDELEVHLLIFIVLKYL
jgi:hypothetical protein